MVTSNTLKTTFAGDDGKRVTYSFADALPVEDIDITKVDALMTAIIANKTQFAKSPTTKVSATIVTTSETELDLSEA